jgi:proteasome lid subunit RPN8/RPN11
MDRFTKLTEEMSHHFTNDYPHEACGIITTDFRYIPCKNLSSNPKNNFVLDPVALLEYEDNTWGVAHSHPGSDNPLPSEEDLQHTVFDEFKFIVGFAGKFYIYWYNRNLSILQYEELEPKHLV